MSPNVVKKVILCLIKTCSQSIKFIFAGTSKGRFFLIFIIHWFSINEEGLQRESTDSLWFQRKFALASMERIYATKSCWFNLSWPIFKSDDIVSAAKVQKTAGII